MARCNCSPRCDVCGDGPCDCTCTNAEKKAHLTKSATGKCFCDRMYPESDIDASCGDCPKRDYKARPAQAVDVGAIREIVQALRNNADDVEKFHKLTNLTHNLRRCADSLVVALTGEKAGRWGDVAMDAARFRWHYSAGCRTESDALVQIELRWLNNDYPSLEEVRQAFDKAMVAASPAPDKEGQS